MSFLSLPGRKAFAASVVASVLFATGAANANPLPFPIPLPKPVTLPYVHWNHPAPHFGYGAAAFVGGLALGAIAAGAASASESDCTVVRRIVVDDAGNEYVRPVRICN